MKKSCKAIKDLMKKFITLSLLSVVQSKNKSLAAIVLCILRALIILSISSILSILIVLTITLFQRKC